ncbi:hypothetical protein N7456_003213 [Penicillium angulare]|uniref:Uncharacterized protein n=1 Tax=Penicillium angulare TaxID=116970 RepID=A0A9W9FUD7_9EURO|nr:hypothetical protein N7456_003213 [Penicillium angulare]
MQTIELNSRPESGPQIHNQYTAPGFDILHFDAVEKLRQAPNNVVFCHIDDYESLYDTYIFMDFVEGETLEKA